MTTWFTSDQHYGHRNIIDYCKRPYSSVEEMNEDMVRRHNERVAPFDVVWHLGDFAMDERYVKQILPQLNGAHYLVAGNHDKCHPSRSRSSYWARKYMDWGFSAIYGFSAWLEFLEEPTLIQLNHFPTIEDFGRDPRFSEYRPRVPALGAALLLCGHVHDAWTRLGPCINVGVDVRGFAPATLAELLT